MENDDRLATDRSRPTTVRRLLLIDNQGGIRRFLEGVFDPAEVELTQATSGEDVGRLIRSVQPEVLVMSDAAAPTQGISESNQKFLTILVGPVGREHTTPRETELKLFDRVTEPIDPDDFRRRIWVALKAARDLSMPPSLAAAQPASEQVVSMVGHTPEVVAALATVERLAHSEASVLICGESGTGKDLLARLIHHQSRRRDHYLITVDCRARAELLERELFGDSRQTRRTRLEQASNGTLYLQHIDRLPLPVQSRLLTILRASEPTTNTEERIPRVLAATTTSLEPAVAARAFREDLLNVLDRVRILLPPLRDRLEDIPHLAVYFLGQAARSTSHAPKSLSPIVNYVLARHRWPGNVRELESVLRRASAFATTDQIQLGDLPAHFLSAIGPTLLNTSMAGSDPSPGPHLTDLHALSGTLFQWARKDGQFQILPAIERELIIHAMAETGGNQVQAARLLGITRATLRKRLHRFNIQRRTTYSAPTLLSGSAG